MRRGRTDDDEIVTPRIRGVIYDAGTVFGRGQRPTRRHLAARVMRRELEVIRNELHATHVRVVASDPARLDTVAGAVAEAGLGLWYSPAVFDYDPAETTRNTVAMAGHAEALRRAWSKDSPTGSSPIAGPESATTPKPRSTSSQATTPNPDPADRSDRRKRIPRASHRRYGQRFLLC